MEDNVIKFKELIKDMDLPIGRVDRLSIDNENFNSDIRWFNRNMFIRNSKHSNFEQASILLKEILKSL